MPKKQPQFIEEGYCKQCGQHVSINSVGVCFTCWEENKKNRPKKKHFTAKSFLEPFVARVNAGEKPVAILKEIFKAAGYEV